MKKVIIILLLMFVDIHGFYLNGFAENHPEYLNKMTDLTVYKNDMNNEVDYSSSVDSLDFTIMFLTEKYEITEVMKSLHDSIVIDKIKLSTYKSEIAFLETGNRKKPYGVKNQYGFMGKYQFGSSTLKILCGAKLINYEATSEGKLAFLKDSVAQEKAMDALVVYNMDVLKTKSLYKYAGKKINGITITAEGMLAGSHLVGPAAVAHYLKNNGSLEDFFVNGKRIRKFDGNGVSVEHYMKIFSKV